MSDQKKEEKNWYLVNETKCHGGGVLLQKSVVYFSKSIILQVTCIGSTFLKIEHPVYTVG